MKRILFALIGLLFAGSVSAQRYYYPPRHRDRYHERDRRDRRTENDFYRPKVGITGGVSIANTVDYYDQNYSTNSLLGWHAGLTFDLPIIYPLSFSPEILYSQKGYKAYTADGDFTQRTHYIDIPLLAKFQVVRGFNFVIGPQLTFPVATTNTYDNGFNSVYQERYYNTGGNKSYVSGVLGVGIDINPNVELRARYAIDFGKNYADDSSYVPPYRNQVWQFGIAFKFQ